MTASGSGFGEPSRGEGRGRGERAACCARTGAAGSGAAHERTGAARAAELPKKMRDWPAGRRVARQQHDQSTTAGRTRSCSTASETRCRLLRAARPASPLLTTSLSTGRLNVRTSVRRASVSAPACVGARPSKPRGGALSAARRATHGAARPVHTLCVAHGIRDAPPRRDAERRAKGARLGWPRGARCCGEPCGLAVRGVSCRTGAPTAMSPTVGELR